jgi:TPP-dependent pyruvate/acetoin dehydrogenase alpha subunit
MNLFEQYKAMLLIRRTEESILNFFSMGKISGTTHTCIGQEANAVGIIGALSPGIDYVISNHRNHGHFLSFGGTPELLLAEVLGRADGVCSGRGGSQHIKYGNFLSNGVQGGGAPVACGIALGEKLRGGGGLVVYCLGDGTLGEGIVYEAANMAALWKAPIIFLIENNGIAQTTLTSNGVAGSLIDRGSAFGLYASYLSSTDVSEISSWADNLITIAKNGQPVWAVIDTIRLGPHSKGDDTRGEDELMGLRAFDPLTIASAKLGTELVANAELEVKEILRVAFAYLGIEDVK